MSIEKLLMKNCWDKKERSFNFLPFEEKRTNFGAGKSKLWQFEVPGGGGYFGVKRIGMTVGNPRILP